jgi:hypothetical protein
MVSNTCLAPRLFRHRQTHCYWQAPCQRWCCPECARTLARQWRAILAWAGDQPGFAPQYFITLTTREPLPLWRQAPPAQRKALREQAVAVQGLTRALTRLVADIRRTFGPFEYLAFVELTTGRRTPVIARTCTCWPVVPSFPRPGSANAGPFIPTVHSS